MLRYSFRLLLILSCILPFQGFSQSSWLDSAERKVVSVGFVSGVSLGAMSFLADQAVTDCMEQNQNAFWNHKAMLADHLGSKKYVIPANALLLGTGYLLEDPKLKSTSWNALKSIASAAVVTEFLKLSLGRARPYMEKGVFHFRSFHKNTNHFKSLPSGHTSLAFAFFTPFAESYSRWLYIFPASVAISRVYQDDHWSSDVLFGALNGFLAGYFFQHKDRNIEVTLNSVIIKF